MLRNAFLQLIDPGSDVRQVAPSVQAAEQILRSVQKPECFLFPAHDFIEEAQFAGRFGLTQYRSRAHRQLHRRAQPRLGQRVAVSLPVGSPDHLVSVRFVQLASELIEDPQRRLGILARPVVILAGEVNLGMVQQSESLEVEISDCLGYIEAALEVGIRIIPTLFVSACHTEVVVGDGAPAIIPGALEG